MNPITTVKGDANIQRCAINSFKKYEPEHERESREFTSFGKVKHAKQLAELFLRFGYEDIHQRLDESSDHHYQKIYPAVSRLKCSSADVLSFSLQLINFEGEKYVRERAGLFLSALANSCSELDVKVVTSYLKNIWFLAFRNNKHLIIEGDIGRYCGWNNEGTIDFIGSTDEVCFLNNHGTINIKGRLYQFSGSHNEGIINVDGTVYPYSFSWNNGIVNMKGVSYASFKYEHPDWIGDGDIHLNGELIVSKGKLIVKDGSE